MLVVTELPALFRIATPEASAVSTVTTEERMIRTPTAATR
jgi:hypothetical protein